MPKKIRSKKSRQTLVIITSLFLVLALPLAVYNLQRGSFDMRNQAYDMLELSEKNPCIISFPSVNPYSLEVGKSVRVQVDAKFTNAGIKKLDISDSTGRNIYTEEFDETPLQMGTSFILTPEQDGPVDILGLIEKTDGANAGCKISSPYDVKGLRAIANNSSPEFTTNPTQSKPSQDIKTGTPYEYKLSAHDTDGDRINYSYSFTPKADWLKAVVIEDGSNGKLSLVFKGDTDMPASYLANIIIHDGYSKNVRSQSWVISVGQSENDMPKVRVLRPEDSLRLDAGSNFNTAWEVSDLNHISMFELFMARNVADQSSWKKIGEDLPYNMLGSSVSTEDLDSGTYKLVVRATDNQDPPKSGFGVSPEIVLSKLSDNTPPSDDVVILPEPQIVNMSPSAEDVVSNPRATIKGTLVAGEGEEINENSIVFKVDDKDVTDKMKINEISHSEYTLIYQPTEDLEDGNHKGEISFEDSSGKSVVKTWDFKINSSANTGAVFNIFGMEIAQRTVFIVGIGILLVIIAACAPLLIAAIWGRGKQENKETTYMTRNTPASIEPANLNFTPPPEESYVRKMVEAEVTKPYVNIDPMATTIIEEPVVQDTPTETEIYTSLPEIVIDEPEVKIEENIEDINQPIFVEDPKPYIEKQEEVKIEELPTLEEVKPEEPVSAFYSTTPTEPITEAQEPTITPSQEPIIQDQPVVEEIKTEEPISAFYSTTTPTEPITEAQEPTITSSQELIMQAPPVVEETKAEEPISAFYSTTPPTKPITGAEEPTITPLQQPIIQAQPVVGETKTEEPVSAFYPTTPSTEPITGAQEPTPPPTTQQQQEAVIPVQPAQPIQNEENTEEIIEPEAPDPSAFLKIAQQIEEQTSQENSTNL